MKPELVFAKIRDGAKGTWRSLKPGEIIEEGDLYFGLTYCGDIAESNWGKTVQPGEAIARLTFE